MDGLLQKTVGAVRFELAFAAAPRRSTQYGALSVLVL